MQNHTKDFLEFIRVERGYSTNTTISYKKDLDQFLKFSKIKKPDQIDRNLVKDYLEHLYDSGYAVSSTERKLACLKSFFHYLVREGKMSADPAADIKLPKKAKRLPKALSISETIKLISAPRSKNYFALRNAALLELLYATGMRASEAVGLNIGDINFEVSFVKCFGKGSKERIVPVNKITLAAIK